MRREIINYYFVYDEEMKQISSIIARRYLTDK